MASNQDEQEGNEDGSALQIVLAAPLHFQSFQEYRRKELFADLCIKCDGKLYSAHSVIVAAASPPMCKLLKSGRVQCRLTPRCTVHDETPDESFLSGGQKNQHQQLQQTSRSTLSLIDVLLIDPAKKVSGKERRKLKKSGFPTGKSSLSKKPDSKVDPASRRKDLDDAFGERCVIGTDKESQSRIAMAVTVCGSGSLTLIVEGVDQEVMDLCVQLMYRESFHIKKCLVPKFISVSRSLELLGFEGICQQLEMHLQGIPAFVSPLCEGAASPLPLLCFGEQAPSTIASVKPPSPGRKPLVSSDAEAHSKRDDVQNESDANEQPIAPLNLSAKDELCMYMDQIAPAGLRVSGTSDNGNVTPEVITASDSVIKEEGVSDVEDDDFSEARNWCDLDENQTSIKDVPIDGQRETTYISEVNRTTTVLQGSGLDRDLASCQNELCATSEQQYLTSEVVIKDEPVEECTTLTEELFEKCTTLTELRAFRFKSERKFTENIDAVMNECSGSTPRSGQHEKIHDQVNKQSEKKKISEFETRGEVEGVDIAPKQSVVEANVLIKDNASEIELGKGSKSSEKFLPVVKEMDLKAIAEEKVKKKDLKVIAEGRVKKKGLKAIAEEKLYMNADGFASKYTDNATGTIASGTTVHETGDSEDKWQQSNVGDSPKLINKLNSQDTNEMGDRNQCVEAALYNEKQETVAFKSGKGKRIEEDENVCQGTVSNEVSVNKQRVCSSNEDDQSKNGGNYCEVKKGTSRPIDVLKPRSNDRVSRIEGSETNSAVDTLESKVSVLVIKGPIHDLSEFNSQESDLSFCETYMAKENSDREDCHQESLSFSDNSSGRLVVTKEGQVDVCEVSTRDSEFLSHTRLSKGTAAFCKIKNKILKNKKRMFSNGSPLEAVISGKLYNCINNPASLQGIECPVTQDTGTKFYVNHKSFKASCATFFTFKKTRREKEIAAYKRKILKSASSFHSKRGGRLSLSQKNITFHSKLRHCKKIGDTFTRTQNSVSEKCQGSVENLTVMQREHSEQECSYVSGERLSVVSGQESVVPSVESGAFQTEKHKATTQKTLMVCEEKSAENIKLQKCRETAALKEEANSLVQKSSVTGPSTFSALGMDPCSSKKPNTCAGSLQDAPECSSVNFCRASATPTGESKNYLGSRKIKTEKENCDDLITNASWGSLAEEVEYVVVRDLAVTSKEKTACLTDRNEMFECTATESVTVIRNHSVLESVDDFSGDNYPVLKSKEFFGSSEKLNEFTSSEEMELSDNNLVVHENLTSLGNQSGTVPVRQRQQIADSSAIHKKQTLKSKAKTFEEICSDNWSFVTNYESRKSKKPKDANIAAEFTVQVGDVSIKIQEYSKEVDKVHPGGPSYEGEPDQPRMNESSSFSFKSESSETTEGAEQHNLLGEKTSDSPDFQEDDKVIFECPCCQEILETEKLLLNHVLQTHKTYLCDYCPVPTCSVLLARNKFRIHLRQHLVTGRYQCSFCSFSASMRGAMSRHESTHTKPQVSKDYKNIKRGGSKYRRCRKKRSSREDSQDYSLDGNNAGGENRGTTALRVTRRASSEGSQKPSLRRSARTVTSGYKGEKVAFMEETKEEVSEEESEFEGDDDKQETDMASSAAPEGILRFELSETVHDASTSTLGNSIEPTVERDIKVDGSSIGDQIFRGLPVSCCSTLLSTVNELVDHVRQCHLSTQRCPSSGIPCIDANCPVFLKATNLAVHIKSHLVPRKISCNLCTYKTNCEFALRTHTLAHNRIKGMKKKKRVLGARRCVLKHRLRLRSQALPEEKANANDTSSKVTHKRLSGQAVNAKAVIQTEPLKAGEPSILKKKTKCLYLYKRKSKLTLQYLRLEREAKKLSEKVQKLDQDIKMVIQDPSQEEEEEVSPSQMTMNSALVSVTNSTLFRKNFLQNLAGEDTMNNDLPFNSEFSKSGKLKTRFGGASDGEKTVGRLENDKIQRKVKSGCGKSIKSKLKSQLLSKTSNKDIKKKRKVSVGGKTQVPDLKSHINKEMQAMAASTSFAYDQVPHASNVYSPVIKPYLEYQESQDSQDNEVAVDLRVKARHPIEFVDEDASLDISTPDVGNRLPTNIFHQNFQQVVGGFGGLNSDGCFRRGASTELTKVTQKIASYMSFMGNEDVDELSGVSGTTQHAAELREDRSGTSSEELDETDGKSSDAYQCPLCSEQYQDPNTLVDHYTLFHSKHSPYVCKFKGCPAVLSRQNSLKHLESHVYKRNFDCPFCSYSHKSLYLLKHHLLVHKEVSETLEENQQVMIHVRGRSGIGLINLLCQEPPRASERKRKVNDPFEGTSKNMRLEYSP